MSGLTNLTKLINLNLSHNKITKIEGLENCLELCNLDVSHNFISDIKNCEQLADLPSLKCVDFRNNQIEASNDLVPFFAKLTGLHCLYLKGNPAVRAVSQYRKILTISMPNLYYLDERPIFDFERLLADAFSRGGKEEEERVRKEYAET